VGFGGPGDCATGATPREGARRSRTGRTPTEGAEAGLFRGADGDLPVTYAPLQESEQNVATIAVRGVRVDCRCLGEGVSSSSRPPVVRRRDIPRKRRRSVVGSDSARSRAWLSDRTNLPPRCSQKPSNPS
jgi:hypothetical protein